LFKLRWVSILLVGLIHLKVSEGSELSRFSVGGLNIGENVVVLNRGKDDLLRELERRTQVDPDVQAGWVWVSQSLENSPPLLWLVLKNAALADRELPQRLQRFMAMGGTVFIENAGLGQDELNAFRELVFPDKSAAAVAKDELLTRTFYILPPEVAARFKTVRQAGRVVWIESPMPMLSRLSGVTNDREMSIRAAINIVLYALTGSYKDDLTHMRYLMRRRKN